MSSSIRITWHITAWEDYLYWQKNDRKILRKVNDLITAIIREPFSGVGKPEPLKHALQGYWSRRITQEHRLVYKAMDNEIYIIQCKYHY